MKYEILTLAEFAGQRKIVQSDAAYVVIDVIRAFTTACFAFAAGAKQIILVGDVDQALAERNLFPNSLAIGEVGGLKAPGFDLGNSPAAFQPLDLQGYTLIQRTSSGTQGMMAVRGADLIFGASFVCAGATAKQIKAISPKKVVYIATDLLTDGRGDEDLACAEYLVKLVEGETPNPEPYLSRVRHSINAEKLRSPPLNAPQDVEYCTALDRFDFGLPVSKIDGRMVMMPAKQPRSY